jgi:hypothetical protein
MIIQTPTGPTIGQKHCIWDYSKNNPIEQIKPMIGQYVIIDLRNMDFMKNEEGKIKYYITKEAACVDCGMYEFENAWVMQLIYNHIEK